MYPNSELAQHICNNFVLDMGCDEKWIVEGKEAAADLTHRQALADVEHDHGLPGR
jgi:hypothetical protein